MIKCKFIIVVVLLGTFSGFFNLANVTDVSMSDEGQQTPIAEIDAVADVYENDDSFAAAGTFVLNTTQDRSIYPIADPDFIVFELDSIYEVTIKTNNTVGDTRIWLYNKQREQIAYDDNIDDDDLNATIYYEFLLPGMYFVKIEESGNDAEIDAYSITIHAKFTQDLWEEDNEMFFPEMFRNDSLTRNLHTTDDIDYFAVDIDETVNVTIETTGTYGGNTIIECRESPGSAFFAQDNNGGDGNYSKITLINRSSGFFVVVWRPEVELLLNYTLHITAYNSTFSDIHGPSVFMGECTLTEEYGDTGAEIRVNIFDLYGISEARLYFRVNYGAWSSSPLYRKYGQYYNKYASIGPFKPRDFVEYYTTGIDNSSNKNEATDDNNGLYYNFTVLHNDFSGPTIENIHTEPTTPNDEEMTTINATITDKSGIINSTVFYRVNSGSWLHADLTNDGSNNYLADLGIFAEDDNVEYYITATDDSTQYNAATNNNSGVYYSFTVISGDHTGPTITNIAHSEETIFAEEKVNITCTVFDRNEVISVVLYFRVDTSSWYSVAMEQTFGNNYSVLLLSFNVNENVEYYIEATDDSPYNNIATNDNNGLYYSFTALEKPTSEASIVFILPVIITSLSFLVVKRKKN